VDLGAAVVANEQSLEVVQPGECALDDPARAAEAGAVLSLAALIVYEAIIDDNRSQNTFGLLMSLNMLIETENGFDYTAADCTGWMTDAGFTSTRAEHLLGPDSMVIGLK
jgi:hypothetical protein